MTSTEEPSTSRPRLADEVRAKRTKAGLPCGPAVMLGQLTPEERADVHTLFEEGVYVTDIARGLRDRGYQWQGDLGWHLKGRCKCPR